MCILGLCAVVSLVCCPGFQSLTQLTCSYETENQTRYLSCDLGNPMKSGTSVRTPLSVFYGAAPEVCFHVQLAVVKCVMVSWLLLGKKKKRCMPISGGLRAAQEMLACLSGNVVTKVQSPSGPCSQCWAEFPSLMISCSSCKG